MKVNICLKCNFKSCDENLDGCDNCKKFCKLSKTNDIVDFNHFVCDNCKEEKDVKTGS